MVWIKLDDNFADHPKVVALSDGAFRMHLAAMAYCGKHLTDGRIPGRVVPRLTYAEDWRSLRDELTVPTQQGRAPLWLTLPCGDFEIHDWLEYNKSAEKVLAERTSASIRDELRRHLQALDLSHKKELSATQVRQLPEHLQRWCVPTDHGFQVSAPTVTELLTADAAPSANARPESAASRLTDTGQGGNFDACSAELRPKLCGPVPVPVPEPDPDPDPEPAAAAAPERACARGPARPPAEAAAAGKVDLDYAKTIGAAFGRPPTSTEEAVIGKWQRAGIPPDLVGSIIREEVDRRRIGGRDPIRSISWFDARVRERGEVLKIAIAQRPEPPTEPGFDFRAYLEQLQDEVPEQFGDIRRELWRLTMQDLDPHELTAELELLDRRLLTKAWEIAGDAKQQEIHQAVESSRAALAARVQPEELAEAVLRAKREIARSALGLPRLDPMLAWAEADARAM